MDTSLWMSRDLLTAAPNTPVLEAARSMAQRRVRHLLIVDPATSRHLVGIVSSHDLYLAADAGVNPFSPRAVDREVRSVATIMTPHPLAIAPTTSIAEAARILRDKKFGALPVVDRGGLVGILTEHDILRAFLRLSGADQQGYEVTATVAPGSLDVIGPMNALAQRRGLHLVSAAMFEQDQVHYAVVHFTGPANDAFVDDLWRSGHRILRVRATTPDGPVPAHA
ncbi:MAG: CBS domain-containing protein [Planctomycetota bacterium]|jgi:acetoin utilization protein AcuB